MNCVRPEGKDLKQSEVVWIMRMDERPLEEQVVGDFDESRFSAVSGMETRLKGVVFSEHEVVWQLLFRGGQMRVSEC